MEELCDLVCMPDIWYIYAPEDITTRINMQVPVSYSYCLCALKLSYVCSRTERARARLNTANSLSAVMHTVSLHRNSHRHKDVTADTHQRDMYKNILHRQQSDAARYRLTFIEPDLCIVSPSFVPMPVHTRPLHMSQDSQTAICGDATVPSQQAVGVG